MSFVCVDIPNKSPIEDAAPEFTFVPNPVVGVNPLYVSELSEVEPDEITIPSLGFIKLARAPSGAAEDVKVKEVKLTEPLPDTTTSAPTSNTDIINDI